MQSSTRRKLEMADRVREFSRAHPFSDPSHQAVVTRFEERLAKAHELAVQEQAGRRESTAARRHRREVRRALHNDLSRYLEKLGDLAARAHPDLVGQFDGPSFNASNAAFLARAWDLLNLAKANRERLATHGLGGTQLDELAAALTRFEAAAEKANAGRLLHVGARAELMELVSELAALGALLDTLNRSRFREQAELLAGWESVRQEANPSRKPSVPEEGGPVPPIDGGQRQAA
jgi:hypothetical protein